MNPTNKSDPAQCAQTKEGQPDRAEAASFDPELQRLLVTLVGGVEVQIPVEMIPALEDASADDLSIITILREGTELEWPRICVRLSVADLLGRLGVARADGGHGVSPEIPITQLDDPLAGTAGGDDEEALVRDRRLTIRDSIERDMEFQDARVTELGCTHVTKLGDNIFLDLGFSRDEAERLLADSKRRIQAERSLAKRDSERSIGAELLEAVRRVKAGEIGAIRGTPGTLVLRFVRQEPLGQVSASDLTLGRLYVGNEDREGWLRVVDDSGEAFVYPRDCFEVVEPNCK